MSTEVEAIVLAMLPKVAVGTPVADIVKMLNDDYKHIKPKRRAKLVSLAVLEIVQRMKT
jgi:hypothetical protein